MEASPGTFDNRQPFELVFGISEEPESTEEKPVLRYERNGFVFTAELDLIANSATIRLTEKRTESLNRDWQQLATEVQKQANEELGNRREKYSDYFAWFIELFVV